MPEGNPLGYSFAPTFQNAEMGARGGAPPAQAQQALQTLSFRLKPRVAGAPGSLSPLQGQDRAGSSIGQAVLESVLRTVLGAGAVLPGQAMGLSSDPNGVHGPLRQVSRDPGIGGGAPMPTVTPNPTFLPGDDEKVEQRPVVSGPAFGGGNGGDTFSDGLGRIRELNGRPNPRLRDFDAPEFRDYWRG